MSRAPPPTTLRTALPSKVVSSPPGAAQLRSFIMRLDRSRLLLSVSVICVLQLLLCLTWAQPTHALAASVPLAIHLYAHRMLALRLLPALPAAGKDAALAVAGSASRLFWTRVFGGCALVMFTLPVAVAYVLLVHLPCSEEGQPTQALVGVWSLLVGGVNVINAAHEGRSSIGFSFPHVSMLPFVRLRAHLVPQCMLATRLAVTSLLVLLLLTSLCDRALGGVGTAVSIAYCGGASGESVEELAISILPLLSARTLLRLLLSSVTFSFSLGLSTRAMQVLYTTPSSFDGGFDASSTQQEDVGELLLMAGLSASTSPLTQHLAFLDLRLLSEFEAPRRAALFAARNGEAWPKLLEVLLDPIEVITSALLAARKERSASLQQQRASLPAVGRLRRPFSAMREQATWAYILAASQRVEWAVAALSNLAAASEREDKLGVVLLGRSVEKALVALLRCLHALDASAGSSTSTNSGTQTRAKIGSQAAALYVAPTTTHCRAQALHKGSSLEGALQRAIFLLTSSFRAHIQELQLPPEHQPKLDLFLRGFFRGKI